MSRKQSSTTATTATTATTEIHVKVLDTSDFKGVKPSMYIDVEATPETALAEAKAKLKRYGSFVNKTNLQIVED